jgi:hypothetical protein
MRGIDVDDFQQGFRMENKFIWHENQWFGEMIDFWTVTNVHVCTMFWLRVRVMGI